MKWKSHFEFSKLESFRLPSLHCMGRQAPVWVWPRLIAVKWVWLRTVGSQMCKNGAIHSRYGSASAGMGRFCTVPERREVTVKIEWVVKSWKALILEFSGESSHDGWCNNQLIPSVLSRVPVKHRAQGPVIGISENSSQSNFIFEQNLSRNLIRLRTPENSLWIHRIGPTGTLEVRNQSCRNQLACT